MSYQRSTSTHHASQCCGIQIDFYSHCGHTLTLTDHSTTCPHSNPFLTPPSLAHLSLPSNTRPAPTQPTISTNPEPKFHCKDLHRYIRFFPNSCTCTNPLDPDLYSSVPARSDPAHDHLPNPIIYHRKMYWLHQLFLEKEKVKTLRGQEMEKSLTRRRTREENMRVPWAERTFVFDPSDRVGDFFEPVDVEKLRGREKTCAVCRGKASVERSRRLPCGCVLCLECVVGWMRGRKDCPICEKVFRLVKVGSLRGEEDECGCRGWEDDGWDGYI